MITNGSGSKIQMMQVQADALVDMSGGTPPVSGTKYEWSTDGSVANAIGTQKNAAIISIAINCTWTVQPTPLEVHVLVDGIQQTYVKADPVSGTYYSIEIYPREAPNAQLLGDELQKYKAGYTLEGRSVKVEAEITGGTVQALYMRVKWAKVV